MQRYLNRSGKSGVTAYEIGADFILVRFGRDRPPYRYSYALAGRDHVEQMKVLAAAGRGLGTYISQNTHDLNDPD